MVSAACYGSSIMKASYYKNLLLVLMCVCIFGCSEPGAPTTEEQKERANELVKAPTELVTGETFSVPELNLDMLWCKPGTFMMGSPAGEKDRDDDETQHEVTLTQGFWLGKHEVTVGQFRKFVESTGYRTDAERKVSFKVGRDTYTGIVIFDFEARKMVDDQTSTWTTLLVSSEAHPVLGVSWNDTLAFCNWLTDA